MFSRSAAKGCDDDVKLKLTALEESVFEKDKLIRDLKDQLQQLNMDPLYRSDLVRFAHYFCLDFVLIVCNNKGFWKIG